MYWVFSDDDNKNKVKERKVQTKSGDRQVMECDNMKQSCASCCLAN